VGRHHIDVSAENDIGLSGGQRQKIPLTVVDHLAFDAKAAAREVGLESSEVVLLIPAP
jgi:hypothetical protein